MDPDPGMFDIAGQVRKALSEFLMWVAESGLKPVLDALGSTVLASPDLTGNAQVKAIWTTSLVVANAVLVLFVIAGGFVVTTRHTLQAQHGMKEILPRLTVGALAANLSLIVCGKAIEAANALTAGIAGQGVDGPAAATAIGNALQAAGQNNPLLIVLLVLAALVMALVVLVTFILRIALLVLLIGVAPLALLCHALPQTEGIAYTWWRGLGACLGIQLGQAVIVLATVKVFLTPAGPTVFGIPVTPGSLLGILVCVTMLWLLLKVPGWMKYAVLGPAGRRTGPGLLTQIASTVVMVKGIGAAARALGAGTHTTTRAARPRPATAGLGTRTTATSAARRTPDATRRATGRPAATRGAAGTRRAPLRPVGAAGPAAFSHAPVSDTPLPAPGGRTEAAFSHPTAPATPQPGRSGTTGVRFSNPATTAPLPTRPGRPVAPAFSNPPRTTPARPASSPAPAVTFSTAAGPQAAPKRPPAPVAPVFSDAPA
ncbi:MAG TPA: hypothetical protein VNV66_20440, partial [Pilimelia sp.]|nr:hypothetical protein [Pilimelia sp.]